MERYGVFRRLLRLGMLTGFVGLALVGVMGRSRFGGMRVMPGDGRMCIGGFGDGGR
jgi:hypothetical protein